MLIVQLSCGVLELLLDPRHVVYGVEDGPYDRQELDQRDERGEEAPVVPREHEENGVALKEEPDEGGDVPD